METVYLKQTSSRLGPPILREGLHTGVPMVTDLPTGYESSLMLQFGQSHATY